MKKKCPTGFVRKKDKCVRKTPKNSNKRNKKTHWFLIIVIVGLVAFGIWYFFWYTQETPDGGLSSEGLLAYYNFDSTDSYTLIDQHGNYDGAIYGDVELVSGKIGNAYKFDGSVGGGYVNIGDEFDGLTDFSICFWFKSHHYTPQYVLGKYQDTTTQTFYAIVHNGSISQGLIQYKTYGLNSTDSYIILPTMRLNMWYFFCGVNDGTRQRAYVNATNTHTAMQYGSLQNNTLDFVIGRLTMTSSYANVSIDEMSVWNRVLNESDVSYLYNSGNGREYGGLV